MKQGLVEAWIDYYETKDEDCSWACEKLSEQIDRDPEGAWDAILAIAKLSNSPTVLSNLAAGPLEDILNRHGADFIDRFEIHTRQNPEFVPVAKGVWYSDPEDEIWARVHAVQTKYS